MLSPYETIKKRKHEIEAEDWLPIIHDELMYHYGWIPLEEFKQLPLTTIWSLLKRARERLKEEGKAINSIRRGRHGSL